jgi:hypothetical protein
MRYVEPKRPRFVAERYAEFIPILSHRLDCSGSSTNGAAHASPGQRPGYPPTWDQALKGRPTGWHAPSGLGLPSGIEPRALPWAGFDRPFGAQEGGVGYGG